MKTNLYYRIERSLQRLTLLSLGGIMLLVIVSCEKNSQPPPVTPVQRTLQVWLHRVNSISKAQHFQYDYSGFELDVHFDTSARTFIVKHDATDTSTLTLSTWLSSITDPARLGYWLDFKNLDPTIKDPALAELLRIRQTFGLNTKTIVVESSNPSCLIKFDTLNFRPSFYIPTFDPSVTSPEDELVFKNFIQENISQSGIKTISGYSMQHEFMQEWFPTMNKLLWYLDSTDINAKNAIIAETEKDNTVEVLLVAVDY